MSEWEIGRAALVRQGDGVAILNFGALLGEAVAAAQQLGATVVDMRWVKPMDEPMVLEMARSHTLLVTVEENAVAGGAGAAVNTLLARHNVSTALLNLGLPDHFVEHGSPDEQKSWTGLDAEGIRRSIQRRMEKVGDTTGNITGNQGQSEGSQTLSNRR